MAVESVYKRVSRRATGTTFSKEKSVNPSNFELLSATHLPDWVCLRDLGEPMSDHWWR